MAEGGDLVAELVGRAGREPHLDLAHARLTERSQVVGHLFGRIRTTVPWGSSKPAGGVPT